jgi:hypothetical protein
MVPGRFAPKRPGRSLPSDEGVMTDFSGVTICQANTVRLGRHEARCLVWRTVLPECIHQHVSHHSGGDVDQYQISPCANPLIATVLG